MEANNRKQNLTPEELKKNHKISSLKYAANNRQKVRDYSKNHYALNKVRILAKRRERRLRLKNEKLAT